MKPCASKAAAKAAGLTRFVSDKPCPAGHVGERFVINGSCVQCITLRKRGFQARTPKAMEYRERLADEREAGKTGRQGRRQAVAESLGDRGPALLALPAGRIEAKALGAERYWTSLECENGHIADRYTVSGHCTACQRDSDVRHLPARLERKGKRAAAVRAKYIALAEKHGPPAIRPPVSEPSSVDCRQRPEDAPLREAAKKAGKKRYQPMSPCSRGHEAERLVSNNSCIECGRLNARVRRVLDGERMKAAVRATRQRHLEKYRAMDKARRDAPEYHGRRRKRANVAGNFTMKHVRAMMAAQGGRCIYCHADIMTSYHVDHKKPIAKGGTNAPRNLQLTCPRCNLRKGAKSHGEFQKELSRGSRLSGQQSSDAMMVERD